MIIVTGAAGFIGSNIVLALNSRGREDILAVDTLDEIAKHRSLNRAEILDLVEPIDFLDDLDRLDGVEAIIHQGACSDTTESDGSYMMENNYRYSITLAEWCRKKRVPFLYASSASVYGNGAGGFCEEREAEDPLNVYAFSKFLFDQWMRRHISSFASQVVGLRYFNVYGPQENHKARMASVIFQFHKQLQKGNTLKLFAGSENFLRDFVFVRDVVKVNFFFLDHPHKSGIFNLGTGKTRSFQDIAEITVKERKGSSIESVPFPADLKGKYQAYTQADLKALRSTGYTENFTDLEDGVRCYLKVLDENEGYWPDATSAIA